MKLVDQKDGRLCKVCIVQAKPTSDDSDRFTDDKLIGRFASAREQVNWVNFRPLFSQTFPLSFSPGTNVAAGKPMADHRRAANLCS